MQNRFARALVVFLLIVSVGGHWAILQSVAWVTMVVDFSKDAPLSIAVQKTFDGKHPCQLCHLVKDGKQSEKKNDAVKPKSKLDYWVTPQNAGLPPQTEIAATFPSLDSTAQNRGESPPVPPPRSA